MRMKINTFGLHLIILLIIFSDFLLIYYFNIFHKLNLDAKKFLNVYKYPFKEQNVINKELIKFWKKVDELIDSDVWEEKYKEVILILIENFKTSIISPMIILRKYYFNFLMSIIHFLNLI